MKEEELKEKPYRPFGEYLLFIEESMIDGQGLFAAQDIPKGTNLGVCHVEIEKDKMSPKEIIRTPLGGFVNHQPVEKILNESTKEYEEVSGPNCERIRNSRDGAKCEWNLIPRKDIEKGQELTITYTHLLFDPRTPE